MKITYVRNLDEVLEHALSKEAVAPPIVPQPEPKAEACWRRRVRGRFIEEEVSSGW